MGLGMVSCDINALGGLDTGSSEKVTLLEGDVSCSMFGALSAGAGVGGQGISDDTTPGLIDVEEFDIFQA